MKSLAHFLLLTGIFFSSAGLKAQHVDSVVVKIKQDLIWIWRNSEIETDSFVNNRIYKKQWESWDYWVNEWKVNRYETYSYDSAGRLTEFIFLSYYNNPSYRKVYQYDSTNSTIIEKNYSRSMNSWDFNWNGGLIVTELDISGRDSLKTTYNIFNPDTTPAVRICKFYNGSDSVTGILNQAYKTNHWITVSHENLHNYFTPTGITILDTVYDQQSLPPYFISTGKKIYNQDHDLIYSDNKNFYDPAITEEYSYSCNHQVARYFKNGINSSDLDSTYFDAFCRPETEEHYTYTTTNVSRSRIIYSYPAQNNYWTFLSDTLKICRNDSVRLQLKCQGGVAPYHYSWTPNYKLSSDTIADPFATPFTSATYHVTVTDANGLSASRLIFIRVDPLPIAYISVQSLDTISTCNSALLFVDTLPGTYIYWWYNGAYQNNHSAFFNITHNGTYVVGTNVDTLTSYNQCHFTDSLVVNFLKHTGPDVQITNNCNQLIAISPQADSIQWCNSSGIIAGETNDTMNVSLPGGSFKAIVVDSFGCATTSNPFYFTPFYVTLHSSDACTDSCNGSAGIQGLSGFVYPVSMQWSTGDSGWVWYLSDLCPGNYIITVTDAAGCIATDTTTVNTLNRENLILVSSALGDSLSCSGIAVISGPNFSSNNYTYTWDNNATEFYSDSLCFGWHDVIITPHSSGCPQKDSVFIKTSGSIGTCHVLDSVIPAICPGQCLNKIRVSMDNGTSPATFFWTNNNLTNGSGSLIDSICAGDYQCIMIDSAGCVDSIRVTITDPPIQPQLEILYYDPANPCQTLVRLSFNNFTPASINWCDSTTGFTARLCPGECFVNVLNSSGCSITVPLTLTIPNCAAFVSDKETSCFGICDGKLTVTASGTLPSHFLWNTGDTSQVIDNLCPGIYTVFYTDSIACMDTVTVALTEAPVMSVAFSTTYNLCADTCTTSASITGGIPPYNITWCGNIISQQLYKCVSSCPVIIADQRGCVLSDSIHQGSSGELTISSEVLDASCSNCYDGVIRLSATGGRQPYHYYQGPPIEWIVADSLFYLPPGIYAVCVLDDNGCRACMSAQVNITPRSTPAPQGNLVIYKSISTNSTLVLIKNAPARKQMWYTIYDITGREIRKEKIIHDEFEIFSGEFNAGLYFFTIETSENMLGQGKLIFLK